MKLYPRCFLGLILAFAVSSFVSQSAFSYYGRNAIEAELQFKAVAEVPLSGNPTVQSLNTGGRKARELVSRQISHLMGTFQSQSFRDEFGYPGVLGEQYEIRFLKVEDAAEPGRKLLTYRFKGKTVFDKNAFRNVPSRELPIKLPLAPDRIYSVILEKWGMSEGIQQCTDKHYFSEGDFWYFWDPDSEGCPLLGDTEQVVRVTGRLERLPNTRVSYPEYDQLYGDNGNGEVLDIAVFLGYINDIYSLKYPNRKDDIFKAFKQLQEELARRGFVLLTPKEELDGFRIYADGRRYPGINFVRKFEKVLEKEVTVRVQLMLADTSISSKDITFHEYLVPAFEKADILIYDGHSGLGGNLDLALLPTVRFNKKSKYQMFFFNGCSSYPYFNGMFIERKGGTGKLDVVTSGLPTYSVTAYPNMVAFLDNFLEAGTWSYQKILDQLEDSNEDFGTYLVGVNGDEDNLWRPERASRGGIGSGVTPPGGSDSRPLP